MKIGIFAGTFDPVHQGHIAFARAAQEQLGLDKVLFMPEKQPRGKSEVTPMHHRLQMLTLALADEPQLEPYHLDVSNFTLSNTLPHLNEQFTNADLYLLLGSDVFERLHTWEGIKGYLDKLTFVVGRSSVPPLLKVSDTEGKVVVIDHPYIELSSSKVRNNIKMMLPPLTKYILQHKLY